MRGVEECLTAGGPWSLEEIENVTGYMSMKDWQLGEQQAEIERLDNRLKVLQDAFQRDIDGSWFSDKFSFDVDQALTGDEVES